VAPATSAVPPETTPARCGRRVHARAQPQRALVDGLQPQLLPPSVTAGTVALAMRVNDSFQVGALCVLLAATAGSLVYGRHVLLASMEQRREWMLQRASSTVAEFLQSHPACAHPVHACRGARSHRTPGGG